MYSKIIVKYFTNQNEINKVQFDYYQIYPRNTILLDTHYQYTNNNGSICFYVDSP